MSGRQEPSFEEMVEQEYQHLSKVHPTPKDIPTCMQLFNTMVSCGAARSQFRSMYRYGRLASCTQKSDDWKFCLTLNFKSPDEKRELWLRRRAEWWARRRSEGSSEDVWEMRTTPLENYPPPPIRFIYSKDGNVIIAENSDGSKNEDVTTVTSLIGSRQ